MGKQSITNNFWQLCHQLITTEVWRCAFFISFLTFRILLQLYQLLNHLNYSLALLLLQCRECLLKTSAIPALHRFTQWFRELGNEHITAYCL